MVTYAGSGIGRPAGIPAAQTAPFGLRQARRLPGPSPPHDQPDSDRPDPTRLGSPLAPGSEPTASARADPHRHDPHGARRSASRPSRLGPAS